MFAGRCNLEMALCLGEKKKKEKEKEISLCVYAVDTLVNHNMKTRKFICLSPRFFLHVNFTVSLAMELRWDKQLS